MCARRTQKRALGNGCTCTICSYCKAVRNRSNYWKQVEQYIGERSEVQFTHGVCPQCFDKVVAEMER